MAMSAPYYKFGLFGDEMSLVVAVAIGFGFGFFLERAGFGSAMKLTSQFYLNDLAVFKVMFTAIITAMLGSFYLAWAGVLDLALVYSSPTYLVPQILGGIILGLGFVIGGYCPGTSVVGVATGRIDALVFILGVFGGIVVFGETYPVIANWVVATNLGRVSIPDLFGLSYGLVVFAVVLMALGGFWASGWIEKRFALAPVAPVAPVETRR
jgi:hypothetical protein